MVVGKQEQMVILQGIVFKGESKGREFINSLHSEDPILTLLGDKPFPGTLGIRLSKLFEFLGDEYGRTRRGTVKILCAYMNGEKVVLKWSQEAPLNVQLISNSSLRNKFSLNDFQVVQLETNKDSLRPPSAKTKILSSLQRVRDFRNKLRMNHKSAVNKS